MKQFLKQWIGVVFAVASFAAPAPYPLTINSRSQTAPPVTAYRGNEMTYQSFFCRWVARQAQSLMTKRHL